MEKVYKRIEYSNENFRKNINYLIQRDNITKVSLDKAFEIGEGSMSRYCKTDESAIEPRIGIINSLANAFGVTIDDLINNDIEKNEKKELEYTQRKEILFCNKLIKETKENLCDWHKLNFYNDGFIECQDYEDSLISNFLESNGKFKSKFTYESHSIGSLSAFTTMINKNTQVIIMEYFEGVEEDILFRYELYLIKSDGKVLASCASHTIEEFSYGGTICDEIIYNDTFYNVLRNLYKTSYDYVTFGKDAYEKELIYDEYLEEFDLPF